MLANSKTPSDVISKSTGTLEKCLMIDVFCARVVFLKERGHKILFYTFK